MAYNKEYYDEKKQNINIKYVRAMEELIDQMTGSVNKFFTYKGELNEQLREILAHEQNQTEEGKDESTEVVTEAEADGEEKGLDDAESTEVGQASEVA